MARRCLASLLQALCCHCLMVLLAATSLLLVVVGSAAAPPSGFRLVLTHVDSKGNFTMSQLLQRAAHRSRVRAVKLAGTRGRPLSTSWDTRSNVHWSLYEYVAEFHIGTPPVPFLALVETSSDLIWTQCKPCTRCAYQQTPVYDPRASRSFSPEPCSSVMCQPPPPRFNQLDQSCSSTRRPQSCQYFYNDTLGAFSRGVLGRETLTFGFGGSRPVSFPGIAFGCGHENTGQMYNSTGTLGLGRGPLSLLAQLGIGKFSYCLTDYFLPRRTSPLLLGSLADLTLGGVGGAAAVQSTPLYQNPVYGTPYYVNLQGISIGQSRLPIADGVFDVQYDGTGGVIFDTSLPYTLLEESAFLVVARHIEELLGMPPSDTNNSTLDIIAPCYPLKKGNELPVMPDMVLHFDEGADMILHRDNYMILHKERSEMCLAMVASQGISAVGNFQQQNMHVLFDLIGGYLSFVPADCSTL